MKADRMKAVVQRRPLAAVCSGMVPSAISGSRRREYIGASSSASNAPINSAIKPISAINVPISLRNQIWSSTGRGVPPCRVLANQSRLWPMASCEICSAGWVMAGV